MNQPEDVEVVLAHDRRYQFHSGVLARNSTLLGDMLTERTAAKLNSKARNAGIKIRWMIALTKLPDEENPAGKLELIPLDPMGDPTSPVPALIINENGRIPTATRTITDYESLLYAFYNREISISDDDMATALIHTLSLIQIGEYLGSMNVISKPIDVALIKHGQSLFRSVQKMPWGWIGLALRIKSEVVFREAVIHLAGNWRKISRDKIAMTRLGECPEQVRALCERLHRELLARGRKLELNLASLYPGGMAQPSEDLPIKREEYAKDILVWMALCFFRHWLGQRIISDKGSAAADGGYALYSQLGRAGEAYMDKAVLNQFHGKFPMTKKAMNVLENHLLEIKECIKKVVREHGILEATCQLDTHRFPVDYLTCAVVRREDVPWFGEGVIGGEKAGGVKRGLRPGGNEIVQRNRAAAKLDARAKEQVREGEDEDEDEEDEEDGDQEPRAKRVRHG